MSVVVIGAGPGLGRALIDAFAAAGHQVGWIVRREATRDAVARTLRAPDTLGLCADAGSAEELGPALEHLAQAQGPADVLIYNAAHVEPDRFVTPSGIDAAQYSSAPGWQARGAPLTADALLARFRANVLGAHIAAQICVPAMIAAGRGTILLTGGVLAHGPWIEWGSVSLGKAALLSLGQSMALELAPHGIRVSTVTIHGTMAPGTAYDPDVVAAHYVALSQRPPDPDCPESHFKAAALDGGDPDRRR